MAAGSGGGAARVRDEVRALLEERQRRLRARIAACEELTAEMAALRAALGAAPLGTGLAGPAPGSHPLTPGPDRLALAPAPLGSAGPGGEGSKAGAGSATGCLGEPEGP